MAQDFDVIIIGSGVAGALAAYKLAQARAKVLLLEAGERGAERVELVRNYAVASKKSVHSPYVSSENDMKVPAPDDPNDYYDQTTDKKSQYKSNYERRIGGSTSHWLGHTPRLLPNDFKLTSQYGIKADGLSIDWPISYDDIESWYCEAEKELGVAGDHDEWNNLFGAFRSRPFPMSKIWPSYSDIRVTEAIAGLEFEGIPIRVFSMPSARNSQPYDGRPICAGNSICVPICPIQAKYDATVHVAKAQNVENSPAEVREKSVVVRLIAEENRCVHQVIYKTWDNQEHSVTGKIVVIAAHAIETPMILLRSGIANSSEQVGRNLMDHLQQAGLADALEPLFPFRGPPSISGIDVLRDGAFRRDRSAFRLSLGSDGKSRVNSPYKDVVDLVQKGNLFGAALKQKLADQVTRQLRISCSTEVLPSKENRVTLSDTKKGGLDLAAPKIQFSVNDYTKVGLHKAREVISLIFNTMKVQNPELDPDPDSYSGAGHIMGTCRMGTDAGTSVVDADCRAHDHPNLFILGSSVFVTGGTGNPTLTVAALALRAAEAIKKQLAQGGIC